MPSFAPTSTMRWRVSWSSQYFSYASTVFVFGAVPTVYMSVGVGVALAGGFWYPYSVEMHCPWRPRLQMNWSMGGSTTTGEEWKMSPSMCARLTVTEVVLATSFRRL